MPPNEKSRPDGNQGGSSEANVAESTTSTSLTGKFIALRVDALMLGRRLELDPQRWPEAQSAFRLASGIANVTRQAFR